MDIQSLVLETDYSWKRKVRQFIFEIYLKNLFEMILFKDELWFKLVEIKEIQSERIIGIITIIVNKLSKIFESEFFLSADIAGNSSGRHISLKKEVFEVSEIVFSAIAKKNSDKYDNTESNLSENLKHSFSDTEDVIPFSAGELLNLKLMLISAYNNSSRIFADDSDNTRDPLKIILRYLSLDEYQNGSMDMIEQHLAFNLKIDNKLFNFSNVREDEFLMRRCSECKLIIPVNMLSKLDYDISQLLQTEGWPCLGEADRIDISHKPHHINGLLHFQCQGFIDNERCNKIILPKYLDLSSIFNRMHVSEAVKVAKKKNAGEAFKIHKLFMDMLAKMPPLANDDLLYRYLSSKDLTVEEQKNIALKLNNYNQDNLILMESMRSSFNRTTHSYLNKKEKSYERFIYFKQNCYKVTFSLLLVPKDADKAGKVPRAMQTLLRESRFGDKGECLPTGDEEQRDLCSYLQTQQIDHWPKQVQL